jgi:L-histidine N-alpha-methyltransferase
VALVMSFRYKVLRQEDATEATRQLELDVVTGLQSQPKHLSSTFFYDQQGSALYQQITELEEYYLTRCEFEILKTHGRTICERYFGHGRPVNLVELGAGDGRKTRVLLRELLDARVDFQYVPIDISESAMKELIVGLQNEFQDSRLQCFGLVGDYKDGLQWLSAQQHFRKNFVLFLGSSIGNFTRENAIHFLRGLSQILREGDELLLGADLLKDPKVMTAAYMDSRQVTSSFNLNLLSRINRELGADFDIRQWYHYAFYRSDIRAVESQLISKVAQRVHLGALTFSFGAFEPIHTEYSHKYLLEDLQQIAEYSGMQCCEFFMDKNQWFVDCIWRKVVVTLPKSSTQYQ